MKITKRQLRRIIKEERRKLLAESRYKSSHEEKRDAAAAAELRAAGAADQEIPIQFTSECMESIDVLIGEGNAQGMSFPDIIGEIRRCLDVLAEEGW